jgi:hypothetical protein
VGAVDSKSGNKSSWALWWSSTPTNEALDNQQPVPSQQMQAPIVTWIGKGKEEAIEIDENYMKTVHNSPQGVSHGQSPHSGTVDQVDEERKSDPGLISSNTQQDGNDSFERIGDEEIPSDECKNQTGLRNASFFDTLNGVSSSFTSYVYNRADSVMNKTNRMIDVVMDRDLKKEEARKLEMVEMELETEKLKSLLALQERENEQLRSQQSEMYPTVDKEELQWIEEDAQAQQSTIIDEFHDMTKKGLESIEALMREMRVSSDEEESD